MRPDDMTKAVASIGLLNGSIRIVPAGKNGRPVFQCAGQQAYFQDPYFEKTQKKEIAQASVTEYLSRARFQDVRDGVAATLGDMSLKGPELYDRMIAQVNRAGSICYAVTAPLGGAWPKAVLDIWPELADSRTFEHAPYIRLFQCSQLADLLSVDGEGLDDSQAWYDANPGILARTGAYEDGSYRYEGLRQDGAGTAVFWARPVDIAKPWCVESRPDGSEDISTSVRPMTLASSLLNLWSDAKPGMGWFVVETETGKPLELYRFPDEEGACMFIAAQFETAMDRLQARGVKDIDPASGIDLDNDRNILVWSEPGARSSSSIQWRLHEGYEGFGLK